MKDRICCLCWTIFRIDEIIRLVCPTISFCQYCLDSGQSRVGRQLVVGTGSQVSAAGRPKERVSRESRQEKFMCNMIQIIAYMRRMGPNPVYLIAFRARRWNGGQRYKSTSNFCFPSNLRLQKVMLSVEVSSFLVVENVLSMRVPPVNLMLLSEDGSGACPSHSILKQ